MPMEIMNDGAYCWNEDGCVITCLDTKEMSERIEQLERLATGCSLRGAEEVFMLNRMVDKVREQLIKEHGWTAERWLQFLEAAK
jgi:hypothetical protein